MEMERKLRRFEKEVEIEKRLKLEAKRDRDECQKEVDELLIDNENIRKRLKQYQHQLEKLQDEHRELMDELDATAGNSNNEELEAMLLEAEAFLEKKFNDERANLAKDIEEYRKQCEMWENKCKNYEEQLQKAMYDVKEARNELANVESYRQGDIDRLLKEKESLKVELKAKKVTLQCLEVSNDELAYKLNEKEKRIRKLEKVKCLSQNNDDSKLDSAVLESKFQEKCELVEGLQEKIKHLEFSSRNKAASEKEDSDQEIDGLKTQLKHAEEEKSMKEFELKELRAKNADLEKSLERNENQKHELQASLNERMKSNESFEVEVVELRRKIDAKETEVIGVIGKNRDLIDEIQMQKSHHDGEMQALKEAFNKYKSDVESNVEGKIEMEAAFEGERQVLNKKLDQVLEANVEIEMKCNNVEVLLNEKEDIITHLRLVIKDKEVKERENELTVESNANAMVVDAKTQVDKLAAKVSKLEDDLKFRDNAMQEAEEQKMKLVEQINNLQKEIEEKANILAEKEAIEVELGKKSEQLESAKSKLEKLGQNVTNLKESCDKLKADLKGKKEESKNASAKQYDLFKKFQDKEKQCEKLEKKLKDADDRSKKSEEIRNSCELRVADLLEKQSKISDDFQSVKDKLKLLAKDKEVLETENKELKRKLEEPQPIAMNNVNVEELHDLQKSLDNMKEREKKIQSHNYELKKRLDAEEAQQKSLKEQIVNLNSDVEKYKSEALGGESKIDALKREIENWQRRFDDIASTLADTESNMQVMSENSSKMAKDLKQENKKLKDELDKVSFLVKEKENEIVLLEKRNGNQQELLELIEKRNAEVKAKNKYIEETDEENSRLVGEVRKQERIIGELEDKIEELESDKDEVQREKEMIEKEFEKNKEKLISLKCKENDLVTAYEDIKILTEEKKKLEAKCEELKKMICENEEEEIIEEK